MSSGRGYRRTGGDCNLSALDLDLAGHRASRTVRIAIASCGRRLAVLSSYRVIPAASAKPTNGVLPAAKGGFGLRVLFTLGVGAALDPR